MILLEEKNAFVAVEEREGEWALYFDRDGDQLARVLEMQGKLDNAFVPVSLVRRIAEEPPQQAQGQGQSQGQSQDRGQGRGKAQRQGHGQGSSQGQRSSGGQK